MEKFEAVLASDKAACVWAALNAATNASQWTSEPIDYARCIDYVV